MQMLLAAQLLMLQGGGANGLGLQGGHVDSMAGLQVAMGIGAGGVGVGGGGGLGGLLSLDGGQGGHFNNIGGSGTGLYGGSTGMYNGSTLSFGPPAANNGMLHFNQNFS